MNAEISGKTGYAPAMPENFAQLSKTRVAIIGTQWNAALVDALVAGARRCLRDFGVADEHILEERVPGAFELPLGAQVLMHAGKVEVVVALGAVIRGETPHFDYVCSECARGLREASQKYRIPLGFGVLTTNDAGQAMARAAEGRDNKGYEATAAALEMLALLRKLA